MIVVNTRQLKKARAKHRSYINNSVANTLVEHNGELRAGNMADMDGVSWKGIRNDHEHAYAGAKQGWLERMNRNATKSWGKAPPRIPRLQTPVPLPPPDIQSAALDSPDEVPGVEDVTDPIADDISAANIDDVKDVATDSQASVDQTSPRSNDVAPVEVSIDEKSQISITTATDIGEAASTSDEESISNKPEDGNSDSSEKPSN